MSQVYSHKLVANVAANMAQEVYEEAARDNKWYARHRDRKAFIRRLAPELVQDARNLLTDMLTRPSVLDHEKEIIIEALAMDQHVPRGAGTTIQ